MSEKVVVTGTTGHIGNALLRELQKQDYEVIAFVLKGEDTKCIEDLGCQIVYGDVQDMSSLKEAFKGAKMVFHLAGIIEIGSTNKKKLWQVNVEGTKNVWKACKEEKVKRLIYTSSVHAIPEKPKGQEIAETTTFSKDLVKGSYAKTKAEATAFLLSKAKEDVEIVIVHPSGVIGPYEYTISNLGQLIIDCANKKIGAYLEGGYNFVDVRDVAKGTVLAAQKGEAGECYILAGHQISVKDLMHKIEEITKVPAPKFKIARWFAYITGVFSECYSKIVKEKPLFTSYAVYTLGTNSNFSNKKAEEKLGYTIRPMEETLKDTIEWFQRQGRINK